MSNIKEFKYDWYWNKDKGNGIFLAKRQPLRTIECISVFYKKQSLYNPQMTKAQSDRIRPLSFANKNGARNNITNSNNCKTDNAYNPQLRYPLNLLTFNKPISKDIHPTQKPVALLEYLIKTYSNEGDLILDNCSGSGSLAIACHNLNRRFICIEKDEDYYKASVERLENAKAQLKLF